jgi:hypothetical protein
VVLIGQTVQKLSGRMMAGADQSQSSLEAEIGLISMSEWPEKA